MMIIINCLPLNRHFPALIISDTNCCKKFPEHTIIIIILIDLITMIIIMIMCCCWCRDIRMSALPTHPSTPHMVAVIVLSWGWWWWWWGWWGLWWSWGWWWWWWWWLWWSWGLQWQWGLRCQWVLHWLLGWWLRRKEEGSWYVRTPVVTIMHPTALQLGHFCHITYHFAFLTVCWDAIKRKIFKYLFCVWGYS